MVPPRTFNHGFRIFDFLVIVPIVVWCGIYVAKTLNEDISFVLFLNINLYAWEKVFSFL